MSANEHQIGGDHYKTGGEEHWDRVARLGLDYFQGQITKYVERWKKKNGLQDLEKAQHFLEKYIELVCAEKLTPTREVVAQDIMEFYAPPSEVNFVASKQINCQHDWRILPTVNDPANTRRCVQYQCLKCRLTTDPEMV